MVFFEKKTQRYDPKQEAADNCKDGHYLPHNPMTIRHEPRKKADTPNQDPEHSCCLNGKNHPHPQKADPRRVSRYKLQTRRAAFATMTVLASEIEEPRNGDSAFSFPKRHGGIAVRAPEVRNLGNKGVHHVLSAIARAFNSCRITLPVTVIGSASKNSISLGYE